MREIKFRAWDELDRKMSIWTLNDLLVNFGYSEINDRPSPFFDYMQYTGLKDKNGKEIYEGDILKTDYGIGEVKYHICTFTIHGGSNLIGINNLYNCTDCGLGNAIKCEIIGNIYENKEVYRVEEKISSHGEDMNITDITFNISNQK